LSPDLFFQSLMSQFLAFPAQFKIHFFFSIGASPCPTTRFLLPISPPQCDSAAQHAGQRDLIILALLITSITLPVSSVGFSLPISLPTAISACMCWRKICRYFVVIFSTHLAMSRSVVRSSRSCRDASPLPDSLSPQPCEDS